MTVSLSRISHVQPFPYVFAFAWIVAIFALGSSPLVQLWRPLLIALAVIVLVMAVATAVGGLTPRTQLVGGIVALLIATAWPFALLVAVVWIWRRIVRRGRERRGVQASADDDAVAVNRFANRAAAVMAVVATVNVALSGGLAITVPPNVSERPEAAEGMPNLHFVMLDGYPRADTLAAAFDFDNGGFIAELESRGFEVAGRSRSNYTKSIMTLASFFNMNYADGIESLRRPADSAVAQARQLTLAINESAGLGLLRERGYEIISSGAAFGEASLMAADTYLETRGLTKFEEQLSRFTWLANVLQVAAPDLLPDQHRDAVRRSFENWVDVATEEHERPYFMFTHVLAPHTPFLFNADGTPRPPASCFPSRCALWDTELEKSGFSPAEYAEGARAQMTYINQLTLDAVARVREADPTGVIVIFSDHGMRHDVDDPDEFFRNLIAVDIPASDENLPEDASVVNLLPHVLNAAIGTDLPIRPYRGWLSSDEPFELTPFEPQS